MPVTAKAFCSSKHVHSSNKDGATFEFYPAYGGGANKAWAQATPHLKFEMTVNDGSMFDVGKEYTFTIEEDSVHPPKDTAV
jgi:hypothetical protein